MHNGRDIHIATIRQDLESTYGQPFADAVALRRKLDDGSLSVAEYDAGVIGLVGSIILTARPIPSGLRESIGGLLGVVEEDRSKVLTITTPEGRNVKMRTDRMWIELVGKSLGICLYPLESYLAGLTDADCGWQGGASEMLSEVSENGIIPPKGVGRIREKLVEKSIGANNPELFSERRVQLFALVERAHSTGSGLRCIPSRVREERLACAGLVPVV